MKSKSTEVKWEMFSHLIRNKTGSKIRILLFLFFALLVQSIAHAQEYTISGQVVAADGYEPLPGVSILLKGTLNGTTTDINGEYKITVPVTEGTLVFSFIGFTTKEVEIKDQSIINIELAEDFQNLGEVVVVGYGTVRKSDLTGSVVSVRDKDLTAIPTTNALETLQGKVPGLNLTKSSGAAGSGMNLNIRGNRSLNAGNSPLILVDGVIYGSTLDVNPNDIASIEVLKDAASTAIYGTLGANGVILITTKKGSGGKAKVSINSYYGSQTLGGYADIMTGPEWVELRREARRTVGEWSGPEDDVNILAPSQYEAFINGDYVDWAKEVLHNGSIQNHQVSVNGGTDKLSYYVSLEYMDEKGLLANDELKRYGGRVSVDYKITDRIKIGTNFMYTLKDHDRRQDPLNQANKMSPLGKAYNEDGTIKIFPLDNLFNLSALADEVPGSYENNELNKRFFGNINFEWELVKDLKFTSRLGLDNSNGRTGLFAATNTIQTGPNGQSLARIDNNLFSRVTWENFLNYSLNLNEVHSFDFLLGTSIWKTHNESNFLEGRDLLSSTMLFYNMGATQNALRIGSDLVETSLASFFGRVNYKLNDKYLFTGVLRSDGSSVLSEGNKWGFFPSAAFAWVMKEEGFLKNVEPLSELKLRLSYGVSGNSAVSPYQTLGGLSKSTYAFDQGTTESPAFGFYPSLIAASNLSWETTASTNLAFDFGFFNNRIAGSIDLYQQDTKDLLMQRALPTTSGFSSSWDNVGKTRNRGIEVLLRTVNLEKEDGFTWTTDFTFGTNKEEIVELVNKDRDLANGWFVGYPIRSFYDYKKIGIWQLGEEDLALENQQSVGEIRVNDLNNDGVITPDDRDIIGSSVPKYSLGINNRVSYKGLELSVFLFARQGQMITSEAAGSYKIDGLENGPLVDYWTPENPTNAYPRPNAGTSRSSTRYYSTLQYVDGSFVKIRDVTLAYSLSSALANKIGMSSLRVYGTAKNYFVWSKMEPYDPERGGNLSYPMTRQLVFGINLGF